MARGKRTRPDRDELPLAPLGAILEVLMSMLGTSQVAVFDVSSGQIHCRYSPREFESLAEEAWATHRSDLLGGVTVRTARAVYFPLIKERVTGILEVVGVDERQLDRFSNALLMCTLRMLPEAMASIDDPGVPNSADAAAPEPSEAGRVMRVALDELERQRLLALLDRYDWVVSAVARADGVDRVTIYRRMARFSLHRREPSPKAPRHVRDTGRLTLRPASD